MLRVLHIDDEPEVLSTVALALAGQVAITSACSLAEARRLLSTDCYDLLLVDLTLPDSQGAATVAALDPYGLPMVVLSGSADPNILQAVLEAGAEDYVMKPMSSAVVLANRLRFAHGRHARAKAKTATKRTRLGGDRFEAIKPFISCSLSGA